jgi:hypothetical protein
MRSLVLLLGMVGGATSIVAGAAEDAQACGGCFQPVSQNGTVVSDHRMVFSVSPAQTTLYDQIKYSGSPSSFAWVLPVHGQVTVALSSDLLFQALDQATQTTILAPPLPACPSCNCSTTFSTSLPGPAGPSEDHGGVTVTKQEVVGPYATVQLHPNSTSDTAALTAWLAANDYGIPANVDSVIGAYVSEGFDFLALRLVPGQGIQAMRPVSVSSPGAGLSLPLRMVAAGTGATVGITLWVVASGRYEPQNFAHFVIAESDLVWDWAARASNYATLRTQKEAALQNAAWQIESSLDLSPYVVENVVLQDPTATDYAPAPAPDGGVAALVGADGGPQTPIEARSQDLFTVFPANGASVRITRMRADLSQTALATDLALEASTDQAPLSNRYQVTKSVNDKAACPPCACGRNGSSGCAISMATPIGGGLLGIIAGLVGLEIVRARRHRAKA